MRCPEQVRVPRELVEEVSGPGGRVVPQGFAAQLVERAQHLPATPQDGGRNGLERGEAPTLDPLEEHGVAAPRQNRREALTDCVAEENDAIRGRRALEPPPLESRTVRELEQEGAPLPNGGGKRRDRGELRQGDASGPNERQQVLPQDLGELSRVDGLGHEHGTGTPRSKRFGHHAGKRAATSSARAATSSARPRLHRRLETRRNPVAWGPVSWPCDVDRGAPPGAPGSSSWSGFAGGTAEPRCWRPIWSRSVRRASARSCGTSPATTV